MARLGKNTKLTLFCISLVLYVFFSLPAPAQEQKNADAPNVVLISVDSLRPKNMSCYGYDKKTTPFLEELCRKGVRFDNAFSQCGWTSPSLVSLLTGFYPEVHGVTDRNSNVPESMLTPIEILARNGYLVPGISHIHSVFNYQNLGFERSSDTTPEQWIQNKTNSKKFFLWHHFYTPHLPYATEQKYKDMFFRPEWNNLPRKMSDKLAQIQRDIVIRKGTFTLTWPEMPPVVALYDADVRQTDDQIQSIIESLKQSGKLENTLIIITADHGEELLERGFIGHASTNLSGTLFDEVLHVPLIMYMPGRLPDGKVITDIVQTMDVMPTVLDILGIKDTSPVKRDGKSLLPLIMKPGQNSKQKSDEVAEVTEAAFGRTNPGGYQEQESGEPVLLQSVRTEKFKLISKTENGKTQLSLYDLKNDPDEKNNIASANEQETARLWLMLDKWIKDCKAKKKLFGAKQKQSVRQENELKLEITYPEQNQKMDFNKEGACIRIAWTGNKRRSYTVEYDVGRGSYKMQGVLPIDGTGRVFGPFPEELWTQFALYDPWRFRVWDNGSPEEKTNWHTFTFSKADRQ